MNVQIEAMHINTQYAGDSGFAFGSVVHLLSRKYRIVYTSCPGQEIKVCAGELALCVSTLSPPTSCCRSIFLSLSSA